MASLSPIIFRDENFTTHRGKTTDSGKSALPKQGKTARQERKALRDLSNAPKPPTSALAKGSTLKEEPALSKVTSRTTRKGSLLTDEEMKKCREWAKEGIEHINYTGNDLQRLQRDMVEQRVRKKFEKAISALNELSDVIYDQKTPLKKIMDGAGGMQKLELEIEVATPMFSLRSAITAKNKLDDPFQTLDEDFLHADKSCELKLKEDTSLNSH